MNYSIILLVIFVCGAKQIYSESPKVTAFKELKNILKSGYEKDVRPGLGETTSEVLITLHISDYEFDPKEKKVYTDMYFRQGWVDSRLVRDSEVKVVGGETLMDSIWTPDTFFVSQSVKTVKYPKLNVFVSIAPNGSVHFSERLQLTSRCYKKDETAYNCPIHFESYGFGAEDIKYSLKNGQKSMGVSEITDENEYKLANYTLNENTVALSSANYSRIEINLLFDNKPVEVIKEVVNETSKEPINTELLVSEGKKIHKMFKNINLPGFSKPN